MTYVIAPTLTGYPRPGVIWLPDQWLAVMCGKVADLTAPVPEGRARPSL